MNDWQAETKARGGVAMGLWISGKCALFSDRKMEEVMMIWHLNKDLKGMRRDLGSNWGDKTQQGSLRVIGVVPS